MKKRLFSLLLVFCLLFSMLPTAMADEEPTEEPSALEEEIVETDRQASEEPYKNGSG